MKSAPHTIETLARLARLSDMIQHRMINTDCWVDGYFLKMARLAELALRINRKGMQIEQELGVKYQW